MNKTTIVFLILIPGILFFSSCKSRPEMRVVINRTFLYQIERLLAEEQRTGHDYKEKYNRIWEDNYYELIYLVTKGDKKAVDISISLLGQKNYPVCLFEEIDPLVKNAYESVDEEFFWSALSNKTIAVQVRALHVFDCYHPIDWDIEDYFQKHPDIRSLYENQYTPVAD